MKIQTHTKPNLLYLAHRIPYPPNKGDKIRAFHEVKFLSKTHHVDLLCLADNPDDLQYRTDLLKWCRRVVVFPLSKKVATLRGAVGLALGKSISETYFYKQGLQRKFDRWISTENYQTIFCFSSSMAAYVFNSRSLSYLNKKTKMIMDFCDLDSDKWVQYSKTASFPMSIVYKLEGKRLLAFETKVNRVFDRSVFVSNREKELFLEYDPSAVNIQVIPNGVDYSYFSPVDNALKSSDVQEQNPLFESNNQRPVLMFSGAMDYYANVDGVQWFCKEIFPSIKKAVPDALFYIVGSHPTGEVKALAKENEVVVTGFVEDIREYYRAADICVIPLRMARGVQNKVLEGMSIGKPVVATNIAIQGIFAIPGQDLIPADTSRQFAQSVIELLTHDAERERLGYHARKYIIDHHNWNKNLEALSSGMGKIVA